MIAGKAFLPFLVLSLALVSGAWAQESLVFRSEAVVELQEPETPVAAPAFLRSSSSPAVPSHQSSDGAGDVWRGIVTGLGIGAAAATITAVWVSAAADLDIEEVADFYVPVVAAVGAAGGALVEASKGAGGATGSPMRVSLGPAAHGFGISATLWF